MGKRVATGAGGVVGWQTTTAVTFWPPSHFVIVVVVVACDQSQPDIAIDRYNN